MWKTIEYSTDRMQEMVDMTIAYYGTDNDISKTEFLKHEYFRNVAGNAFIKLAYSEENEELAGQYIVIPVRIKISEKIQPAILSLNTLTKEAYRGQKIFVSLAEEVYLECSKKGYKFCYGAPNPNSHPGFLKRLGFRDIGTMPLYLKIIHPSVLVREKFCSSFLEKLSIPFNTFFRPSKMLSRHGIFEITLNNVHVFDSFWNKISNKYRIMGVRDAAYMKWRYLEMPYREYKIFSFMDEQEMKGYIVGRITEVAGMKCGMIVDYLVDPGNVNVAKQLIGTLEEYFYKFNVGLMGCLMQKHFEEADYLKQMRFFICPKMLEPQPIPIIFRKFNDIGAGEEITDFSDWFFTMGDYDVI